MATAGDGGTIGVCHADGSATLLALEERTQVHVKTDFATCLCFTPDSRYLIVAGRGKLGAIDTENGELVSEWSDITRARKQDEEKTEGDERKERKEEVFSEVQCSPKHFFIATAGSRLSLWTTRI